MREAAFKAFRFNNHGAVGHSDRSSIDLYRRRGWSRRIQQRVFIGLNNADVGILQVIGYQSVEPAHPGLA